VYVVEEVFSEDLKEIVGDISSLVPVYRTVRGYDEKRRRPVLYQTLVHEEKLTREVVVRSITYHLVLRKQTRAEVAQIEAHIESLRKKECAPSDRDCLASLTPDPFALVHTIVTISVDKDGSRAMTMMRSVSVEELRAWWLSHASSFSETYSSEKVSKMMEEHVKLLEKSTLALPKVLAAGGLSSPTALLLSSIPSPSISSLKVLSVNLWNYNYWTRRVNMIARILRQEEPDVVGFQEVRSIVHGPGLGSLGEAQTRWQVSDLAKALPEYEFSYIPAMGFKQERDYVHEGLAVFSRYPISSITGLKLTRDPQDGQDFHQRLCLHARVRTKQGWVNVMTTHLSLSLQARTRTLPEVSSFISSSFPSEPSILVGDFNAQFNEGPSILTRKEFGGFQDAWRRRHREVESEAELDQLGWTFHSWSPRSRIDFVFFRSFEGQTIPVLDVEEMQVIAKEGEGLKGEELQPIGGVVEMKDTMYPSDHRFLSTVFRIERKATVTNVETQPAVAPTKQGVDALNEARQLAADLTRDPNRPQPLTASVGGAKEKDEL
jgi:endonuclease/exonuclease/phosphatase family metal-dependent hydrolase